MLCNFFLGKGQLVLVATSCSIGSEVCDGLTAVSEEHSLMLFKRRIFDVGHVKNTFLPQCT